MNPWYRILFENYAKTYDKESFTQGTLGEVNFIEGEIGHDKNKTVLDIACGTGRHSIELASRGYTVTGVDLSESQLARAKEKAAAAGISVRWMQMDAREMSFAHEFDLALMLCEGAFPLMETDEMNFLILANAAKALRPGGRLIMTTLNALFPLFHSVRDFINSKDNQMKSEGHSFDLMTFRDRSIVEFKDDSGKIKTIKCDERYYTPPEIAWMLQSLRFSKMDIFGCKLGAFSRNDKLTTEDYEMLVIAEMTCGK
jgi:2-polyprenyl-3-methyl-5-hydroxy-6-metoxy-1,4-benzoquinol methylase